MKIVELGLVGAYFRVPPDIQSAQIVVEDATHPSTRQLEIYTALEHTKESYQEPDILAHLVGGIEWAAGTDP